MTESDSDAPYIEIDLTKIHHNAKILVQIFKKKNIVHS